MSLECPANYFGRGEGYILKDDPEEVKWFEEKFKEWEEAHPEDPTGDIALAEEKKKPKPIETHTPVTTTKIIYREKEISSEDLENYLESTKLRLELPASHIQKLKNFAKFKRRRPRDIVMFWIDQYCKL